MNYQTSLVYQQGAALIVGLIFLVIMSIMGLTSIQNVTLQERIIGQSLDGIRAAQTGEIALLTAESNVQLGSFLTDNNFYNDDPQSVDYEKDRDFALWSTCGDESLANPNLCENLNDSSKAKYQATLIAGTFLITVQGQGKGTSKVILQTKYQGKFKEQD